MQTSKRTPGPLEVRKYPCSEMGKVAVLYHGREDVEDDIYYVVAPGRTVVGNAEGDARLFAAAPDLLDAARAVLRYEGWYEDMGDHAVPEWNALIAAVRKATRAEE